MNQIQNSNQNTGIVNPDDFNTVPADVVASLVLNGDLSKMSPDQKVTYYRTFCTSLGLNPLTQPFEIIILKGKERMYAKRDCTDQLRKIYGVSVTELERKQIGDIFLVTAKGSDKFGRVDSATGAVSIQGQQGENLANAIMKAETKAKRRLTLSLCGLGMLDETEVESAQNAIPVTEEQQQGSNYVDIDVINPQDQETVAKFEQLLQAIPNPIVPNDYFGGMSKEEFVNQFRQELMSGTLSVQKADKIYQSIWNLFQNQQ